MVEWLTWNDTTANPDYNLDLFHSNPMVQVQYGAASNMITILGNNGLTAHTGFGSKKTDLKL